MKYAIKLATSEVQHPDQSSPFANQESQVRMLSLRIVDLEPAF
jgi:hypothetical protein